ncbi:hypothetical protein BGZ73_006933 [Actinomortierella ambigua]|nr:hypothetical protein BGZ73_006933 [Actinomortierella ambigua]
MKVGTGVRPKPMDCIVFWVCIACVAKIIANFPLIFDVLRGSWWLRIAFEQLYWIFVAIAFSSYFVGLLYAMPVTTREGIFAVYQPEVAFGAKPLRPIHVLTPTTVQKNFMLIMGLIYPTIFGACMGITSGIFHDLGREREARIFLLVQYSNWVLILWSMAALFFYYGLKYTFILRANIIIAEAALRAPKAAFGLGNLRSSSPARFLFIQLQITGFGGCAVTLLAGSLCMIWVLFKDEILKMQDDKLPHTMAFFWTGAIALAYIVIMSLITVQSVRNRRRGLHEPSTDASHSYIPGGSGSHKGSKDYVAKTNASQRSQSQQPTSSSDPEARLTEQSSMSTLNSHPSIDKIYGESLESYDDLLSSPSLVKGGDNRNAFLRESVYGSSRSMQTTSSNSNGSHPRQSEEPGSVPLVHVRNSSSRTSGSRPSSSSHFSNSATSSRVSNPPSSSSGSQTTSSASHFGGIHPIPEGAGDLLYQDVMPRRQQPSQQQHSAQPSPKARPHHIVTVQQPSPALLPQYQQTRSPPLSPRHTSSQQPLQQQQQQPSSPRPRQSSSSTSAQQQHYQQSPQQAYVHYPQYTSRTDVVTNNMQTQQQHPLHQVAYKGLSPPPRAKRAGPPLATQVPSSSNSPTLQGYGMPVSGLVSAPAAPPRTQTSHQQAVRSDSDSEVSVEGFLPMPPTHR